MAVETFSSPGTFDWTAPVGVVEVVVEAWGPGGGGGDDDGGANGGGGGGGGGYAIGTIAVTPGTLYSSSIVVGGGGAAGSAGSAGSSGSAASQFNINTGANYVRGGFAGGGLGGGGGGTGGAGGAGTTSGATATATYTGGTGATQSALSGGGGGGSGGTGSNGNNGVGTAGGAAVTGGGAGGNAGAAGSAPGGGGGGANVGGAAAAGADGKVVLTYSAAPDHAGFRSPTVVSTPSPPPFPGGVHQILNQFGTPPAAVASGALFQYHAETSSPPPFAGEVHTVNLRAPVQPGTDSIAMGATIGLGEYAPFQGDVRTALATPFGISALPSRPVRVETASPPPFPGAVVLPSQSETPRRAILPIVIRETEPSPEIRQPAIWGGTPAREAVGPPVVVVETPGFPAFPGEVISRRSDFGIAPIPARPVVAKVEPSEAEPGRVIVSAGRVETVSAPAPVLAALIEPSPPLHQPVVWSGTPAREAIGPPVRIVAPEPPPPFPGEVVAGRSAFGVGAVPSRPVVVALEPSEQEPGRVVFSRSSIAAPVLPPVSLVVAEIPSAPFSGEVVFIASRPRPVVFQRYSVEVRGEMAFAEAVQPVFSWGQRNLGSSATPLIGAIVYLTGADTSIVTIDSENWEYGC